MSALKENEVWLDSISGKVSQFNNAVQAMWNNTLDSDLVKWFVGLGTELIKIVDAIGLIPSILAAILAYKLAIGAINMFDLTSLGTYIGMLFTANNVTEVQGLLINKTALAQKLLNSTLIQAQAARMGLTAADLAGYSVTQLLTLGVHGLAAGFKNLWIAMGPVGWAIIGVTVALTAGIAIFNAINKTTEELQEELDGLKSELSSVRSELDSVNSELETTQERMAELLAMDKLTFEEQEELDRLRATNDELERRKDLLEDEDEIKSEQVGRKAAEIVNKTRNETLDDGWRLSMYSAEEDILNKIDKYKEAKTKFDNASSLKEQEKYQKELDKQSDVINKYILSLSDALDGVEYGDSEESDEALDYLAELQDTYGIARGSASAKTNAIKGLFNKDEFAETKTAIDGYVKALADGDANAANSIVSIINSNKNLVKDLEVRGLEAQDAIDYFTKLGSEANYATLEGKIAEMQTATSKFQTLLSDTKSADFTGLFDEDGEVSETAIAEYFQGTSEATREEIAKIVKNVNDGKISVENALKQFELFGIESTLDIQIKEVQTNFKDVFVDLGDADGLINTFEELGEAIGSTVGALDALNKAQGEMDYSGRVSIQTALELMQYTDNYADVLEVVDGKLQLNKNAEENLINARITAMKVSAQTALADAQAAYEKAKLATQTYNDALTTDMSASVVAKAWEKVLAAGSGLVEGIKSLFTEESWTEAYNRAYNETLSKMTGYETTYDDAGLQALKEAEAEAEQAVKNAQGNVDLLGNLNADNIKEMYESDDIEDPEDAAKTKLEEKMERFQQEMDYWENRIGANQARYEQLQNEIDLLEAKGQKADSSYYEEQVQLESQRLTLLEGQKAAALEYLATLEEGSEEWWEVANVLNGLESDIDDVTASIIDLQDAIGEIDAYKFEEFNNRLDNLTSKLGTIRDLIAPNGEEDWFDDEGQWTEAGVAVLGAHIQELEFDKEGLKKAQDELDKYAFSYGGNEAYYKALGIHSEQEYYDKVEELTEQQYQYLESINDTEQSIVDMYESNIDAVEEYTESLIDSYNDYIDSVKEALQAERDLYDFKKNVQKQSKDISAIERRIASLSGSTNASDVAERRKLEAELYESRESLNDTYYDHARSAQDEALSAEQTAYEETMTKFIEGLRMGLDQATANMDEFLMSVTSMVTLNADTVLAKYQETELPLGDAITNPWKAAKDAVGDYSGDALGLMDAWVQNGFLTDFPNTVKASLESPWQAGQTAVGAFKSSVDTQMAEVVSVIETNVKTASGKLSELYQQIQDTANKSAEVSGDPPPPSPPDSPKDTMQPAKNTTQSTPDYSTQKFKEKRVSPPTRPKFKKVGDLWSGVGHTGVNIGEKTYNKALEIEGADAIYYPYTNGSGYKGYIKKGEGYTVLGNGKMDIHSMKPLYQKYAKGTTGTPRDEWAITDESQFGDELVLIPGKDGNLSFVRKGTGIVPADMTQKLFELAQIPTSDLMNKNLTAIVPNITKNDFKNEFNFESLVHVDTVDSDTLPKLEKMVDKKIDDFSRALNYSLKKFAR